MASRQQNLLASIAWTKSATSYCVSEIAGAWVFKILRIGKESHRLYLRGAAIYSVVVGQDLWQEVLLLKNCLCIQHKMMQGFCTCITVDNSSMMCLRRQWQLLYPFVNLCVPINGNFFPPLYLSTQCKTLPCVILCISTNQSVSYSLENDLTNDYITASTLCCAAG